MRPSALILSFLVLLLCFSQSFALTVFDPQNYTQNLLTATRQLKAIEQRIQQLANEAQMLINMEKQLRQLGQSLAEPINAKLRELQGLIQKAKGLALSIDELEEKYNSLFPDAYEQTLQRDQRVQLAKTRWEHRLASFKAALGIQATIFKQVEEDSTRLKSFQLQSKQAIGTTSAIQAGNELLALNVKQLLQLQTLLATQGRAEVLNKAEQASSEAEARATFQKFIGSKDETQ